LDRGPRQINLLTRGALRINYFFVLFFGVSLPAAATLLEQTASSMQPGTWKVVPMKNVNLTATAYYPYSDAPGPGYDGTQPGWNSKKRKLYIETTEHGASSDCVKFPGMPNICYKPLWTYDDATDSWEINGPTPAESTSGIQGWHHYNEVAWDDDNEVLYIREYYSGNFYRYCVNDTPYWCAGKRGAWSKLPPNPYWGNCCEQMTYNPALNGGTLLYFDASNPSVGCGSLVGYSEMSGVWYYVHDGAGCYFATSSLGRNMVAGFSSSKQVAVFGGGEALRFWKIDQHGAISLLDNAPCSIGSTNGSFASFAADPVSGNFIVIGCTSAGEMWELNPTANSGSQWTLIDGSLNGTGEICNRARNVSQLCSFDFYATPISTYGVIGYWKWVNTTTAEYWLYKHETSSLPPPPADTTAPVVSIMSPPTGRIVTIINPAGSASRFGTDPAFFSLGQKLGKFVNK
jgi:hypothetical protein